MGTAIPFDLSHHRTRRVPVLCTFVLHTPSFGSPAAIPSLSVDTDYFHSFNATIRVKELHSPQRAFQSFLVESFQLRQLPTQTDSPVIPISSDDSVLPAILPLRSSASTYKYLQQSSNCLAKMQFSKTALLALCASSASAYSATKRTFAVNHFYGKGPLVVGRMDPIVNPGVASGHVHAVQGGNAFALSMTDDQALKSTCTSSRVKDDKSNYWTPALYFQDPQTGKLEPVEMFYMNVYYFFDATTDKIEAFPEGLRIFTGNPSLRTPPATGGEQITDHSDGTIQPIQWTCPRSNDNSPLYPADSNGRSGVGMQDPARVSQIRTVMVMLLLFALISTFLLATTQPRVFRTTRRTWTTPPTANAQVDGSMSHTCSTRSTGTPPSSKIVGLQDRASSHSFLPMVIPRDAVSTPISSTAGNQRLFNRSSTTVMLVAPVWTNALASSPTI